MKPKYLLSLTLLIVLVAVMPSCKKKQVTTATVPYADTLTLLSKHKWYVDHIWADYNNNGIADSALSELIPGTTLFRVYTFARKGDFSDSTPGKVLYGTWYFKGATKDSVYITIDTIGNYLHSILSISEDAMVTKKWGSLERWYFTKF